MRIRFSQVVLTSYFLLCLAILGERHAFANIAGNWSFEDPLGDSAQSSWDSTNGATRDDVATAIADGFNAPPDGQYALKLAPNTFTFQVYKNIKPGDYVSFSAFFQSLAPGGASGVQLKIEFQKVFDDGTSQLIKAIPSGLISTVNANPGAWPNYRQFEINGVAPEGTGQVVFTFARVGAGAGLTLIDKVNAEINPAKNLSVTASRNRVKIGQPVQIHTQFVNAGGTTLRNLKMTANVPKGFSVVQNSIRLNGNKTNFQYEDSNGSFVAGLGSVAPGVITAFDFVVVPSSGVTVGKIYGFDFVVSSPANQLSTDAGLKLLVEGDPVFDEGTIIGKVFNDTNQNGVQDEGEKGVPFVQIATEQGMLITTDENGKYHVPAVSPGRHLVKIDGHSLPEGTKFITEESYLVKVTPGILNKVNFAVLLPPNAVPEEFQKDLTVRITQGLDTSRPNLSVEIKPEVLRVGLGLLEKEAVFKFKMNYPDMVKNWFLEIRDELGQQIWTGFGVGAPPAEVVWSGKTETGFLIKPGIYSYRFKVQDSKEREDWTPLNFFRVVSKADSSMPEKSNIEIPSVGDFNLFKDGKRSIPLIAKPTVRIQGKTRPENKVTINSQPVAVNPGTGDFQTEIYVTPGEKEFLIEATDPDGSTVSSRQKVKVKDSTFFMVALGEDQMGYNFNGGKDTAGNKGDEKQYFYNDGRLAYFLRGKIKGKFLVSSRYDTGDKSSALFTNLNPDHYYPVYGDASTINYEAKDTLQRFYVLVEMDRSFAKWGSFKTEFNDTELGSYNRTLSGLKVHYETVGTTPYGDPKRGFKFFWTKANQTAAHNEFMATGGSLYYLRNRNVIEGSEKIRVEVRDKIQNMAIESRDLTPGADYQISYEEGRILLSRPLSSVAASDTIISRDILDGNPVFLVVDYEYEIPLTELDNQPHGVRGFTHLGDHIRVGATAIEEARGAGNDNYQMRAVDATMKFGRNTKMTAEYATTERQQMNQSVSYNGGLSFANAGSLSAQQEKTLKDAYLIKGESKPLKKLEVSGYLQGVGPGFSNDHLSSQEGTKKYGVTARYKFTDNFYARYRFDESGLVHILNPVENNNVLVPFVHRESHTAQLVYDDGKYLGQLEYLHQRPEIPGQDNRLPSLDTEFPFDQAVGGKLGYRLNEKLLPYVRTQVTFPHKQSYQFGGGIHYEFMHNIFANIEEMFGNIGDSTLFGLERYHENGARSYANIRMRDQGISPQTLTSTIGSSFPLTEKSRVYSEKEYSTYQGENSYADILGYQGKPGDHWDYDARFERRHLDQSSMQLLNAAAAASLARTTTYNTVYGAIGYANGKKLRARGSLEVRRDEDSLPELWQWVTRDSLEYQINRDLSYLGKLDYGTSRFTQPSGIPADFMELSTGFAYRPIDNDKFNVLSRYTYTRNIANDVQFLSSVSNGPEVDEIAHIVAIDVAYDLFRYMGIVEKLGYRLSTLTTSLADKVVLHTLLGAQRFNFHVTRKWDLALEYRIMFQSDAAQNIRMGPLVEIDREFYDYVKLGAGYNFTHFDDDLRKSSNYDSHGPFVRLTGKF